MKISVNMHVSYSNPQTILDDSLENYFNMNMCIITSGLFYIKKTK